MNNITYETRSESNNKIDKATRQEIVLNAFREYGNMTARECGEKLGYSDLNNVKPRISEMCEQGKLSAINKVYDTATGRKVAVFGIIN
jgi:predicted HTH transcriptional regulator